MEDTSDSLDLLRNLNRLRSKDPADRLAGITGLSGLLDDPRVRKVFEHLYRHDSDPEVRARAWQALASAQPSVPGPFPAPVQEPAPRTSQSRVTTRRRVQRAAPHTTRAPFLLNPRHARQIVQWQRQRQNVRPFSWRRGLIFGLLMLVTGLLWAAVLPDWGERVALRRQGVTVPGTVVEKDQIAGDRYSLFVQYRPIEGEDSFRWLEQRVSKGDYEWLSLMAPVEVRYVPDHPELAEVQGVHLNRTRRNAITLAASLATALLIVGPILARLLGSNTAPARRVIPARVIASQGVEDADGDYKVALRYRFRSPTGRMITGQLAQVRNSWRGRTLPAPGTRVMVDYRGDDSYRLL